MKHKSLFLSRYRIGTFLSAFALTSLLLISHTARADSWALLIGIDQYDDVNHINPLGGAASDARAIAKTLRESAGFSEEHIKVLVSDGQVKPTRVNILNALARLADNAKPGGTVFVLYSGHGMDINGIPYLLPYDTSAYDDSTIADSALETAKFRARLGQVKAKALILAFDMCRSDPRKIGKDVTGNDNKLSHALARGFDFTAATANPSSANALTSASAPIAVTLYSCTEGERSYEWQDKGRGYFSYYLEQGLKGAAADATGQITVGGLAQYVESSVKSAVTTEEHRDQTPYPSLDGPGAAEFVLAHVGSVTPLSTPLDTATHVTVNINAANATVLINGNPSQPGHEASVDFGLDKTRQIEIGVIAPGYQASRQNVTLTAGAHTALSITLKPIDSFVSQGIDADAAYNLGAIDFNDSKFDSAIAHFTTALKLRTSFSDANFSRGLAYEGKKDWKSAIADFTKVITKKPRMYDAYVERGRSYEANGDFPNAKIDLTNAQMLKPDRPEAYQTLGDAYFDNKQFDKAIAVYSKYLTIEPNPEPLVYKNRSIAESNLNDRKAADADFQKYNAVNRGISTGTGVSNAHRLSYIGVEKSVIPVGTGYRVGTPILGTAQGVRAALYPSQVSSSISAAEIGGEARNHGIPGPVGFAKEEQIADRPIGKSYAVRYVIPTAPAIPESLKDIGFDTKVTIRVTFGADGQSRAAIIKSSGFEALDKAALAACVRIKFKCAYYDSSPIDDSCDFTATFHNKG